MQTDGCHDVCVGRTGQRPYLWNAKVVKNRAAYCGVSRRVLERCGVYWNVEMNVQVNVQMNVQLSDQMNVQLNDQINAF